MCTNSEFTATYTFSDPFMNPIKCRPNCCLFCDECTDIYYDSRGPYGVTCMKMSKQTGIDIINDNEFKIKWWDLNHEAQKRLLNTIFRTKPIAIVEFDYEDDEKENIVDKLASIGKKIDLTDEEIQAISKHVDQSDPHIHVKEEK